MHLYFDSDVFDECLTIIFLGSFPYFKFLTKINSKVRRKQLAKDWPVAGCFGRLPALIDSTELPVLFKLIQTPIYSLWTGALMENTCTCSWLVKVSKMYVCAFFILFPAENLLTLLIFLLCVWCLGCKLYPQCLQVVFIVQYVGHITNFSV